MSGMAYRLATYGTEVGIATGDGCVILNGKERKLVKITSDYIFFPHAILYKESLAEALANHIEFLVHEEGVVRSIPLEVLVPNMDGSRESLGRVSFESGDITVEKNYLIMSDVLFRRVPDEATGRPSNPDGDI